MADFKTAIALLTIEQTTPYCPTHPPGMLGTRLAYPGPGWFYLGSGYIRDLGALVFLIHGFSYYKYFRSPGFVLEVFADSKFRIGGIYGFQVSY